MTSTEQVADDKEEIFRRQQELFAKACSLLEQAEFDLISIVAVNGKGTSIHCLPEMDTGELCHLFRFLAKSIDDATPAQDLESMH